MSGQINRNTPFGDALYKIASQPHYNIFLDIGSWNGLGTTKILVDATKSNDLAQIISVEANADMYKTAVENWQPCPNRLSLRWGRIATRMMSKGEVMMHHLFEKIRPHFDLYFEQDEEDFYKAPRIELPQYVDVAVMDGGEFCGRSDLETVLSLRPKVIALDDINIVKNNGNYRSLIASGEWHIVARGDDKTGWAILQRGSSATPDWARYTQVGLGH